LFATSVTPAIRIIEPGTRAVSTPVAPISPMTHGGKVARESLNSDRSTSGPVRPGTCITAVKPITNTNRLIS
jgi:hypothetical protein